MPAASLFLLLSATLQCVFACIFIQRQLVRELEFIYKYYPPEADKVKSFWVEKCEIFLYLSALLVHQLYPDSYDIFPFKFIQ